MRREAGAGTVGLTPSEGIADRTVRTSPPPAAFVAIVLTCDCTPVPPPTTASPTALFFASDTPIVSATFACCIPRSALTVPPPASPPCWCLVCCGRFFWIELDRSAAQAESFTRLAGRPEAAFAFFSLPIGTTRPPRKPWPRPELKNSAYKQLMRASASSPSFSSASCGAQRR